MVKDMHASSIIRLLESFAFSFNSYGNYCEVFQNPDDREWRSIGSDVRFIINARDQHLYIFNGFIATHDYVARHLHTNLIDAHMFFGDITRQGRYNYIDRFSVKPSLDVYDLSWTEQYDVYLKDYVRNYWDTNRPLPGWIR